MAYTIYEKRSFRLLPPAVTITAAGKISLNATLTRMFHANSAKSVLLLSDLGQQKIALTPALKKDKRSFNLSYGPDLCQASLSAKNFLTEIGWDGEVYNIPAQWDEKKSLLEFDIPKWGEKQVVVPVTAGRKKAG